MDKGSRQILQKFTLRALQKTFVEFFFESAWKFCTENGGHFW